MRRPILHHLGLIFITFSFLAGVNASTFVAGWLSFDSVQAASPAENAPSTGPSLEPHTPTPAVPGLVTLAPVIENNSKLVIDPRIESSLKVDGAIDFWVRLRQETSLKAIPLSVTPALRTTYVYDSMSKVAAASQAHIIAYLKSHGLKYDSHWIVNSILVHGASQADLDALSSFPEVLEIQNRFSVSLKMNEDERPLVNQSLGNSSSSAAAYTNWGLDFTQAPLVWNIYGDKGAGVVVANIDSGVMATHPALINQYRGTATGDNNFNWFAPPDLASNCGGTAATAPCDTIGHGTHTMGIMVGDDGAGHQTGMAPQAQWIACMACDSNGNCNDQDLTTCAEWVIAPTDLQGNNPDPAKAANIVNNSWGESHISGDTFFQSYVQAWTAAGIFPAFSIGNDGPNCSTADSPGDYPESFATGAVDSSGTITWFSSRGPGGFNNLKPNLVAPGLNIVSSWNDGGYFSESGTSMASPHTAGAVALLWSAVPALKGEITQTISLLASTANPDTPAAQNCGETVPGSSPDYTYGYGYLDSMALVTAGLGINPELSFSKGIDTILVNNSQDFSIQIANPPDGTAYSQARLNIILKNTLLADINSFEYFDGNAWQPVTLVQSGMNLTGYIGQESGFLLGSDYKQSTNFRISWSRSSTYPFIFQLVDLATPHHVLDSLVTTSTVVPYSIILPIIFNNSYWP